MAGGKGGGLGGRGNKPGSHRKGAMKGSGGKNRRALEGRGPTPPAELRAGHPAHRRAAASASSASPRPAPPSRPSRPRPAGPGGEYVVGRNAVLEALRARVPATALYVATGLATDPRVRDAVQIAADADVPLLEVGRSELDRYAEGAPHQGVVLAVAPHAYLHPDDLLARALEAPAPALLVALDGVTDPRNLGATVRSVAAFGGTGVLVPERRAAGMTAGAWKASAGAAAHVPVARAVNLVRTLVGWQRAGLAIVGLDAGADLSLDALDVAVDPLVIVVGSEGRGLSRLVRETCDVVVAIPMAGPAESLNAGVAAGVALYEVSRRRRSAGLP